MSPSTSHQAPSAGGCEAYFSNGLIIASMAPRPGFWESVELLIVDGITSPSKSRLIMLGVPVDGVDEVDGWVSG